MQERTRPRTLLFVLLTAAAVISAACDGGDSNGTAEPAPSGAVTTVQARQGGTLTYASDQQVGAFNNNTSKDNKASLRYIIVNVYPQLFRTTPDFKIVPDANYIESAVQTSNSPQTVVFKLNKNAVWSDGKPFSADDLIWNWHAQNGTIPGVDAVSTTGYEDIATITPSDGGKTATLVFKKPYSDWNGLFENILPAHIMTAFSADVATAWNTGLATVPTWSGGPFKISSYEKDKSLTLVPNDRWWGEKPKLDSIVVRFGIGAPAVPQALQNKEIDMAYPQPQIDLVAQIKNIPGVKSEIGYGLSYEHIDFNFKNEHLALKEVRQAIAYALDRDDIVNRTVKQFDSRGKRLDNRIWLTGQPEYQAHGQAYAKPDPKKAESLLETAGYVKGSDGIYAKAGKKLSLRISTTGGNALREQTEQLIQAQLKAVGIDIVIANVAGSAVFDEFVAGNFDIALFAWVGTPLPVSANKALFSTDEGSNFGKYSNPKVDSLFEEATANPEKAKSVETSQQIDTILWEDMATLPLYAKPQYLPYRDTFVNVQLNATTEGPIWNAPQIGMKAA